PPNTPPPMDTTRRRIILTVTLGVAISAYLVFFTDIVFPPAIPIEARPLHEVSGEPAYGEPIVVFTLGDVVRLHGVTAVALDDAGKPTDTVWSLAAETRSMPVHAIVFGSTIPGMRHTDPSTTGELEPGRTYRVTLRAGRRTGTHDFTVE
ncbi:MAG: hypothetical protein AAF078_09830, partial [Planctomycetota bacterium]